MVLIRRKFWRVSRTRGVKHGKLKLNGKTAIDPTTLVDSTEIGPQMASDVVNLKPQEIFEIVEEELVGKSKEHSRT